MQTPSEHIRQAVHDALKREAMGARRFEQAHGLRPWSLRGLLDPDRKQVPSVDRAAEICEALGLELAIHGPQQETRAVPADLARELGLRPGASVDDAVREVRRLGPGTNAHDAPHGGSDQDSVSGENVPAALRALVADAVRAETQSLRAEMRAQLSPSFATRQIEVVEVAAAAGAGVEAAEEQVVGALAFRRDWLESRGLDPTQCVVISVRGASMEPTLPEGARILVNRSSRQPRVNRLYVLRAGDGLIVKRAGKDREGGWLLVSDNPSPDYPALPWPDDAEIIGQVRWMARTFE